MGKRIKLYFNPRSRAVTARWMLEEVGAEYELETIDFEKGDQRSEAFLKLNPMGKIPTLVLGDGTVLAETPAIVMHLADLYLEAELAAPLGTPERASTYRWLFFGAGCFEPALTIELIAKLKEPLPSSSVGWGDWQSVLKTLESTLAESNYLTGEKPTAADIYIGAQLIWARMFGAPGIADNPVLSRFADRMAARPAHHRAFATD
ncbi:Glutathione S-transferase [Fulvimarina pelagi HTCC2506]|uniref:Glutathione S-transferase n=2 Tax=Fulvimarina pelagi TaxID=217511 RepID=Q0G0J6_9HYPH|nr:glutathione S-transferase family protein [Fulvimarina pelagi]EAU40597.1 Glutathione S-transferase [Fulvimarina pelagi HTCC2506]BAT31147.1 glutathione S-transferase [Fulvimarina pelagi]